MAEIIKKEFTSERERVRDLAKAFYEYAVSPLMESRRNAWSEHNALNFTRPLIYIRAIPFAEFFDYGSLKCGDSYLRSLETEFLHRQYHSAVRDDYIEKPFMTVRASLKATAGGWGLPIHMTERPAHGGAAAYDPVLLDEQDLEKMSVAPHEVNEQATKAEYDRLCDLLGDIMPVYIDRQGVLCGMWSCDIATTLAKLRDSNKSCGMHMTDPNGFINCCPLCAIKLCVIWTKRRQRVTFRLSIIKIRQCRITEE